MSDAGHHIIPKQTLFLVFGALIVLTGVTVGAAYVPMGPLAVPVAIGIAATKAALVVLYFMALKYDNPVNALTFTIGSIFVVVFIGVTMLDTAFRGDLSNVNQQTITQMEKEQEEAQQRQEQLSEEALRIAPADYPDQNRGASSPSQ